MSQGPTTYERLSTDGVRGQQVMVDPQQQRGQINPRLKYNKVLHGLGVTEVVLGCLSLVLSVGTLAFAAANPTYASYDSYYNRTYYYERHYPLTHSAQGLWGGVFLVVTGIIGIRARKTPSVGMYKANMVLSIITANVVGVDLIISSLAAGDISYHRLALIGMHVVLAVIALVGVIICIIHSAYCCAGTCCRSKQFQGTVMYVPQQYIQQPQQQMVQLANGQYMMVPSQPMMVQGYPGAPVPMVGSPMAFQTTQASGVVPQMTMPPVAAPSTSLPQQPVQSTKEQEAQMEAAMANPPGYSTLSCSQDPTA